MRCQSARGPVLGFPCQGPLGADTHPHSFSSPAPVAVKWASCAFQRKLYLVLFTASIDSFSLVGKYLLSTPCYQRARNTDNLGVEKFIFNVHSLPGLHPFLLSLIEPFPTLGRGWLMDTKSQLDKLSGISISVLYHCRVKVVNNSFKYIFKKLQGRILSVPGTKK